MATPFTAWMCKAFSAPRLGAYAQTTNHDAAAAERLYWWNLEISGAFYGPLHCLEVALRNSLHDELRSMYARDDWWSAASLRPNCLRMVAAARDECAHRPGGPASADDMVAALTFGFWTALLSTSYDRQLWIPCLHRAFPNYRGRRGDLHDNLNAMRLFRNRIVHHEPIHHRDLAADHRKIYRLLNYIDATAAREALAMDRVPIVLAHRQ